MTKQQEIAALRAFAESLPMNTPTTYLSLSYETGWKLIHNGQPVTASNRTIEQCYEAADSMGLMPDAEYWDGELQQFIDPMHSNNDDAVELSSHQQHRCSL